MNAFATKKCHRCGKVKPSGEFGWRRKQRGQRESLCKPCRSAYGKEHDAANRERYIAQAAARKQAVGLERTRFLIGFFASRPCSDCGETNPVVLEFDHRCDKSFTIGLGLRDRRWQEILDEISKCDVVCANCHRRRTARRRGSLRAVLTER